MSATRRAAMLVQGAALLAAGPVPGAEPNGPGLAHCVAIASAEARLACYDSLAGRPASGPSPIIAARTLPEPVVASTAPTAAAVAAAAAPVPAAVSGPDPAEAANDFGLSNAQRHSARQGPQFIEARVAQVTVDRSLRNYVVLDNGQTWAGTEGALELNSGEQVTIKRAALGSFLLVSTGSKHAYHVRRVR